MEEILRKYRECCNSAFRSENPVRTDDHGPKLGVEYEEESSRSGSTGSGEDDMGSSTSTETVPIRSSPGHVKRVNPRTQVRCIRRSGLQAPTAPYPKVPRRLRAAQYHSRKILYCYPPFVSAADLYRKRVSLRTNGGTWASD